MSRRCAAWAMPVVVVAIALAAAVGCPKVEEGVVGNRPDPNVLFGICRLVWFNALKNSALHIEIGGAPRFDFDGQLLARAYKPHVDLVKTL